MCANYRSCSMRIYTLSRSWSLLLALALMGSLPIFSEDNFSLSFDSNARLVITGAKNKTAVVLPPATVDQVVRVGDTSFHASYGQDEHGSPTAVFSPDASDPKDLHFDVLSNKVDADSKAIVTMTFSNTHDNVHIDPGSSGFVYINSAPSKPSTLSNPGSDKPLPESIGNSPSAPVHIMCDSMWYEYTPAIEEPNLYVAGPPPPKVPSPPYYWSEPVTSPLGTSPTVGPEEMRLVECQGEVELHLADGTTQMATEGRVVPSGAILVTQSRASVAVFMGGVNSVRLMPNTEVKICQDVEGSVRNTLIDLDRGTAFSRVGSRHGERQNYQVRTSQGTATATGTEFADVEQNHRHYLFVVKGSVNFSNGRMQEAVSGLSDQVGSSVFEDNQTDCHCFVFHSGLAAPLQTHQDIETSRVLYDILNQVQPYNRKMVSLLGLILDGTATEKQLSYYNNIKRIYFDPSKNDYHFYSAQILNPFQTPPLTPF